MSKEYFKLFSCCIPVRGYSISIICDIQRIQFHYIPNALFDILKNDKIDLETLYEKFDKNTKVVLEEYFNFLLEEEYGFLTDSPDSFPEINRNYHTPYDINNAIIDISKDSKHDFKNLISHFDNLGCPHLELRFFDFFSLEYISIHVLNLLNDTRLRGVSLYIKYFDGLTKEILYKSIIQKFPIILDVFVHSSPFDENHEDFRYKNISFISQSIESEKHCGNISLQNFSINQNTFLESLSYNTCLNKKVSIDSKGMIKNCPSMFKNYGSHKEVSIKDVLKTKSFQRYWKYNKDAIDVCKDCQFRYICTDCRAYVENPKDDKSKPLKCGYNPYTNSWEEWSENPLKLKAIEYYGMQEFVKKDA